ncbi:hypothetical protein JTB14_033212 [Gonioctena quinquepunctata]|nr:hypothetical protein JTB14_033212 [Gonioctena quinquepunctata]
MENLDEVFNRKSPLKRLYIMRNIMQLKCTGYLQDRLLRDLEEISVDESALDVISGDISNGILKNFLIEMKRMTVIIKTETLLEVCEVVSVVEDIDVAQEQMRIAYQVKMNKKKNAIKS